MNAIGEFRASWDRTTWISTILVLLIILGSSTAMLLIGQQYLSAGRAAVGTVLLIAGIGELILLLAVIPFAPRRYQIDPEGITVRRLGPDVSIAARDILEVRPIELHHVIRTLGVGGLFGAWGWFTSDELDRFRAYVTRRHGLVVVQRRNGEPIVLSPDEPQAFIQAANTLASQT